MTSKHSSLIGWFNKCFIFEEKIFDERMSRTYRKAFEKRQECDYGLLQELDRAQVMKDFDEAREFITIIETHIKKELF